MSCYRPMSAYRTPEGEVKLGVAPGDCEPLRLPCGRCTGCIWSRRRAWQLRLMHEAMGHTESVVATLTYSDEHVPSSLSLEYSDFQGFMKRLRKARLDWRAGREGSRAIRFFVAGEYGGDTKRPHFHAVLFNCWFPDQVRRGRYMYSDKADALWARGRVVLDSVTPASAGYVAGYAGKKKFGKRGKDYYEDVVDVRTGELSSRRPEFLKMSLKPGIGGRFYERFGEDLWRGDFAVQDGQKYSVPRYYFERLKRVDPARAEEISYRRFVRAKEYDRSEETPERRAVREAVHVARIAQRERRAL